MDISVLCPDVSAAFVPCSVLIRMDTDSDGADVGIGLSDRIRYIHELFSHSFRSETHPAHSGKHVQLYSADNSNCHQRHNRNGYAYMAESAGCSPGIRWCHRRQPKSLEVIKQEWPALLQAIFEFRNLLILIPALDLDVIN